MIEIWKPIAQWEGCYEISNKGRVKSLRYNGAARTKPKILKPFFESKRQKYEIVTFRDKSNDKSRQDKRVHLLVITTFKGKKPKGFECRHLNGNSRDNRPKNLAWGTRLQNKHDSMRHGTYRHTLKKEEVLEICKMIDRGILTQEEIAQKYGVHNASISMIKTGTHWNWLTKRKVV